MTSKEKVLSVYPDATAYHTSDNYWTVLKTNTYPRVSIYPDGVQYTEAEAWEAAKNQLPSAPSPAGETASTEFGTCEGSWHMIREPHVRGPQCKGWEPINKRSDPFVDAEGFCRGIGCGEGCYRPHRNPSVPEPVSTEVCVNCRKSEAGHWGEEKLCVMSWTPLERTKRMVWEPSAPEAAAAGPVAGVSAAISGSVAGWTLYRAVRDFLDSARSRTPFGLEVMDAAVSEWEAENPPSAQPSAEGDGWIAVTPETLPPDSVEEILVWYKKDYIADNLIRLHTSTAIYVRLHPEAYSHWRPLPAPPSGQGEKE